MIVSNRYENNRRRSYCKHTNDCPCPLAAVVQLTKQLAQELSPHGITVNTISLGFVRTPFNEEALKNPILLNKIKDSNPMHRTGKLEELIPAVLYLASPFVSYTTGQNLLIDGGTTSHAF